MGIPDGAHTHGHGSGGSGLGELLLILLAVALLGPAVAAAVAELLHVLIIVIVVLAAVAGAGLVALGAWRLRQARPNAARVVHPVTSAPWRPAQARTEPRQVTGQQPPAIEHHHHVHFHGLAAEDVATILDRRNG
jgi:hypothetical protein